MEFQKLPPQNADAEASLLSAILHNDHALYISQAILKPEDFYVDAHRKIYQAMLALSGNSEPVDIVTVTEVLEAKNQLESIGGSAFIGKIIHEIPIAVNPEAYAKIVRGKARQRNLLAACQAAAQSLYGTQNPDELIANTFQLIRQATDELPDQRPEHLKDIQAERMNTYRKRAEIGRRVTGVRSGLWDLDACLSGFQPSDLIIVAARPGIGKTALAGNILVNAAEQDTKCLMFSLEMSKEQIFDRLIAKIAKIDSRQLITGRVGDWSAVERAAEWLESLPIWIDDSPKNDIHAIRAKAMRHKQLYGLDFILVDYLQIVKIANLSDYKGRDDLAKGAIANGLKDTAKELKVPVVALAQLNREYDKGNRLPRSSDLKDSGIFEQASDVICLLHQQEQPKDLQVVEQTVIVDKHRNGPTGIINLRFDKKQQNYMDSLQTEAARQSFYNR